MKEVILYQFHGRPEVCRQRVELFRALNPGVPIYGVFGGSVLMDATYQPLLQLLEDPVHVLPPAGLHWWKNTDLALREWFRASGWQLDFDIVHMVQWDLLYAIPFNALRSHVSPGTVILTAPVFVDEIASRWHWTSSPAEAAEWHALQKWAAENHGWSARPVACLGPGYSLPKSFLEQYSRLDLPEFAHDELRVPLGAQILGFDIRDTGFYRWFDPERESVFNANGEEVAVATIEAELATPTGCRVFHPCRMPLPQNLVMRLIQIGTR